MSEDFIPCTVQQLPEDQWMPAADEAVAENPVNAVRPEAAARLKMSPQDIAFATGKFWGRGGVDLGVFFMDTQDTALMNKILAYMNKWGSKGANIRFRLASRENATIRIARHEPAYWSYVGTDCCRIPSNQPTMMLGRFTLNTPDGEYDRVVCHEAGHALGCPHEHMRADIVARLTPQRTVDYFSRTQGWSPDEVYQQVLTPLNEKSLMGTPADVTSIMCYQLPGSITEDGKPIPGGNVINDSDYAYAARVYPGVQAPPPPPVGDKVQIPREGRYRVGVTSDGRQVIILDL